MPPLRIFVTGSTDGIGLLAARNLIAQGHSVHLHARSQSRASEALSKAPGAAGALIGDLSSLSSTRALARAANEAGPFDVAVYNAGVGFQTGADARSEEGVSAVFAVNVLAPYMLAALAEPKPRRMVFLSSSMHFSGDASLADVGWMSRKGWSGTQAYSDSKLLDVLLAMGFARRFEGTQCHAVDPGWVKTKMGGMGAPGSTEDGARTMTYLASTDDAIGTAKYWASMRPTSCHKAALDEHKQDELLRICADMSGVALP